MQLIEGAPRDGQNGHVLVLVERVLWIDTTTTEEDHDVSQIRILQTQQAIRLNCDGKKSGADGPAGSAPVQRTSGNVEHVNSFENGLQQRHPGGGSILPREKGA